MIAKLKKTLWDALVSYGEYRYQLTKRNNYRWYY